MNKTILATLVAAGQLLLTQSAQAMTFNFSWRSDAPGLSIFGGGVNHMATGTLDINVRQKRKPNYHPSRMIAMGVSAIQVADAIQQSKLC